MSEFSEMIKERPKPSGLLVLAERALMLPNIGATKRTASEPISL